MGQPLKVTKNFTEKVCGTCGVYFFIPDVIEDECHRTGRCWYCPNGHGRHYTESIEQKLQKEIRLRKDAEWKAQRLRNERNEAQKLVKARDEGIRKMKIRSALGVCPCCKRHFDDLESHMASKHPDYAEKRGRNLRERDERDAMILRELCPKKWQTAKQLTESGLKHWTAQSLAPMLRRLYQEGLVARKYEGMDTLWRLKN